MSRNVKNTSKPSESKKPHCKVCFDAGKSESEYTSHWVRSLPDRNGRTTVTCPTLLANECNYCYEFGHTVKFCPVIKKHEKHKEHAEKKAKFVEIEKKKSKVQEKRPASVYAVLMDSDSEEETLKKVNKPAENYPILCENVKKIDVTLPKPKPETKTGWAAIVAKPVEVKKAEPVNRSGLVLLSDFIKEKPVVEEKKPAPWANKQVVVTKSWADESDSEDDVDDYDSYKAAFQLKEVEDDTW